MWPEFVTCSVCDQVSVDAFHGSTSFARSAAQYDAYGTQLVD